MDPLSNVEPVLVLLGVIVIPAIVVFIVLTVLRVKRSKFHRQRIHRGASSRH